MCMSLKVMGENLIIDRMIKNTGVRPFLLKAFGKDDTLSMLDLASYLLCADSPLSSAEYWLENHGKKIITSERVSELLVRLNEDKVATFLCPWMGRKGKGESLCYDITSVSSHARYNHYVEWGHDRDKEKMKQINLALLQRRVLQFLSGLLLFPDQ